MPWGSGIFITIRSIMLEIFFPLPTTNCCQKSLLTLRSTVRMAAPTWVGPLWNVGNIVGIRGMSRVLEMKATQCMCTPGPTREKATAIFNLPSVSPISSSLKLWFPGSCWSGSGLLRLKFAQHWFCLHRSPSLTSKCKLWLSLSTFSCTFHTPFCPSVLPAQVWKE